MPATTRASSTTRQAFDALATGFGPGFNGPLIVAATVPAGQKATVETPRRRGGRHARRRLRHPGPVQSVGQRRGDRRLPDDVAPGGPDRGAGPHLARPGHPGGHGRHRGAGLRGRGDGRFGRRSPTCRCAWSGSSAAVLLLAFLLLMAVFRSLAIPVKAVVVNLLSVGAAYGVIVAVFQWGWLGGSLRIGATGPIDPWIPLMMFTILFGLSMDYEVFLLSRIREEWRLTGDNSIAVADGLAKTARVITAAAAIMICVFGSFVFGDPLHVLKVFGLGLAAAILIDATLVRMVLVPSVMELLGPANWWMPAWLDRIVPRLGVEVDVRALDPDPAAEPVPA